MKTGGKIVIIAIVLLTIAAVAAAIMFNLHKKNQIMDGPDMINTNGDMYNTGKEYPAYETENALELANTLGKTPEQAGIDDKYVNKNPPFHSIAFFAKLFGKNAHGTIEFSPVDTSAHIIDTVYVNTKELSYEECREKLIEIYGEPDFENEEPYVESLGGAVTTCEFKTEKYTATLKSASEESFIHITFRAEGNS